jgi:hypothetical protein
MVLGSAKLLEVNESVNYLLLSCSSFSTHFALYNCTIAVTHFAVRAAESFLYSVNNDFNFMLPGD